MRELHRLLLFESESLDSVTCSFNAFLLTIFHWLDSFCILKPDSRYAVLKILAYPIDLHLLAVWSCVRSFILILTQKTRQLPTCV